MKRFITRINGFANEELKRKQDQVWKAACGNGWLDMPLYVYSNKDESQECRQARFDGIIAGISRGDVVVVQLPTGNGAKWEQQFVTKIKSYGGRVILFLHALSEKDSINVPETYGDILYTSSYQEAIIVNSFEELEQLHTSGINGTVKILVREKAEDSTPDAFLTQEFYTLKSLNMALESILTDNGGIYKLTDENKIRSEILPQFTYAVARESYGENHAISFAYSGEYDWITVVSEKGVLCETKDSYCHYLLVDSKNVSDTYIIKAYVQTSKGKMLIAESEPIRISKPIVDKEHPKLSIIIPAYNSEKFISRCMDTVLAQTNTDLEIIVVNDGSTDHTKEIVEWYMHRFANVHIINQKNLKSAIARNVGVQNASGEYIAFIDSDDMIRPDMMKTLYKAIKENNCDIASSAIYNIIKRANGNNEYLTNMKYPVKNNEKLSRRQFLDIYMDYNYPVVWNKLYRKDLIENISFPVTTHEDEAWTPVVLSYANSVCHINTCFYEYDQTQNFNSVSTIANAKSDEERFQARKEYIEFFLKNGNPEEFAWLKAFALKKLNEFISAFDYPAYKSLIEKIKIITDKTTV